MDLKELIEKVLKDELTVYNQNTGKKCRKCNEIKGINDFYYHRGSKSHSSYCKKCNGSNGKEI